MDVQLSRDEKRALSVLAFLFYRMGLSERAAHVYAGLAELCEPGTDEYRLASAGLAAASVDIGRGKEALAHVRNAVKGPPLKSGELPLHLLRAQALWLEGRRDESAAACDEYLYLSGRNGKGEQQ